jgi:hypothetical protein
MLRLRLLIPVRPIVLQQIWYPVSAPIMQKPLVSGKPPWKNLPLAAAV